jgi:hypothetical protein
MDTSRFSLKSSSLLTFKMVLILLCWLKHKMVNIWGSYLPIPAVNRALKTQGAFAGQSIHKILKNSVESCFNIKVTFYL